MLCGFVATLNKFTILVGSLFLGSVALNWVNLKLLMLF